MQSHRLKTNRFAYAPDSSDYVPVVGSEGTVEDFESGSMLVVSEEPLGAELASVEFMSLRATKERGNPGWIQMAATLAPSPWSLAPSEAHAASDICSEGSNHCCEINSDGSFECYYPLESETVTSLKLAVVSPSGEIGEVVEDNVQENLKWLKSEPTDVVIADGDVVSVAEGLAIKAQADESGDYAVTGDFDDADGGYRNFDAPGSRLQYTTDHFVFMDPSEGISTTDVSGTIKALTKKEVESYTVLKTTGPASVYFGVEADFATKGTVFYFLESDDSDGLGFSRRSHIQFIVEGDLDDDGIQLTHAKTINFDVNASGYALVAYKDLEGKLRLRVSDGESRFGGTAPLLYSGEEPFFSDIRFITDDKALLLDSANKKLWMASLNKETKRLTAHIAEAGSEGVSVGLGARSIMFNNSRTRAYVLNEGDETITVVNLKNGDRADSPLRRRFLNVGTISLSDYVPGKALSFEPKAAVAQDNKIIIASKKTKALLFVDTETFSEADSSEEDNDGDGYTASEGDCNDEDAALHPATVWYLDADSDGHGDLDNSTVQCEAPSGYVLTPSDCDDDDAHTYPGAPELCDGIDNSCEGEVDEDVEMLTWYADDDSDGYGDPEVSTEACTEPEGYVIDNTDCDDDEELANPGLEEICGDGIDNNCGGGIDNGCDVGAR